MKVKSFSIENSKMSSLDMINTDDEPIILLKGENDILFLDSSKDIVIRDATDEEYKTYLKKCKIIYQAPSGKQSHIHDGRLRYETDAKCRIKEMSIERQLREDLQKEKENNIELTNEVEVLKKELEATKYKLQKQEETNNNSSQEYEKLYKTYNDFKLELQKEKETNKISMQQLIDKNSVLVEKIDKLRITLNEIGEKSDKLEEEKNILLKKEVSFDSAMRSRNMAIEDLRNDIEYLLDFYYKDFERLKNKLETTGTCLEATAYELQLLKENITDVLSDFYEVQCKYNKFYFNQQDKKRDDRLSIVANCLSKGLKSKDIHKILIDKGINISERMVRNDIKSIESRSI